MKCYLADEDVEGDAKKKITTNRLKKRRKTADK